MAFSRAKYQKTTNIEKTRLPLLQTQGLPNVLLPLRAQKTMFWPIFNFFAVFGVNDFFWLLVVM